MNANDEMTGIEEMNNIANVREKERGRGNETARETGIGRGRGTEIEIERGTTEIEENGEQVRRADGVLG